MINTLKNTSLWVLLLAFTFTACNDHDDDLSIVSNGEYTVALTLMGGYSGYTSIYTGNHSQRESAVAFRPLKERIIKEMEIKVSKNTLAGDGKVVLRKNGSDAIVQEIEKGATGYFVSNDSISLSADDEVILYIDSSSQKQGDLEPYIRVVIEYP